MNQLNSCACATQEANLEVCQRWFGEVLIWGQSLVNDSVGTLGVQLDSFVGTSDNDRHPFPGRIEFAHIQDLILFIMAEYIDEHRFRLTRLIVSRTIPSGPDRLTWKR